MSLGDGFEVSKHLSHFKLALSLLLACGSRCEFSAQKI